MEILAGGIAAIVLLGLGFAGGFYLCYKLMVEENPERV